MGGQGWLDPNDYNPDLDSETPLIELMARNKSAHVKCLDITVTGKPHDEQTLLLPGPRPVHLQVNNLADLFAQSPFRGLDMEFERDQEAGRDIPLGRDC
jgi:hypothetical protein